MKNANGLTILEKITYLSIGYLKEYLSGCNDYDIKAEETNQIIELYVQKDSLKSSFLMLRIGISESNKEIYLYNIFLPQEDRGNGIGLGFINVLYQFSQMLNYSLVLHSMTESFYSKMLERGAAPSLSSDCLIITEYTSLH